MALLHALGRVCKFYLRCKNLYRIGPWSVPNLNQIAFAQAEIKLSDSPSLKCHKNVYEKYSKTKNKALSSIQENENTLYLEI